MIKNESKIDKLIKKRLKTNEETKEMYNESKSSF